MTQKHFELIAHIIDTAPITGEVRRTIAEEFAKRLAYQNAKFNADKFIKAATRNPAK